MGLVRLYPVVLKAVRLTIRTDRLYQMKFGRLCYPLLLHIVPCGDVPSTCHQYIPRCSQSTPEPNAPIRMTTYGRRAFGHAVSSSTWNALSNYLKTIAESLSTFGRHVKYFAFLLLATSNVFEVFFTVNALYKLPTYLLSRGKKA